MLLKEPPMIAVKRVGIVGCGLMGSGVAQVCAQARYPHASAGANARTL